MPDFGQYLSFDYWRAHRLELAYGIVAFVLFLGFLFATFPYTAALEGALTPMGLRFQSSGQSFALPFGARLENVSIRSRTPGTPPMFESKSVRIAPSLLSLLVFHPGINVTADAYSGSLSFGVHRTGEGATLSFDADKVDLAAVHLLRELGAALGGRLSGDGSITFDPASPAEDAGTAQLHAKGFMVRIPGPMAPLGLGEVEMKVKLVRDKLQVEELKSSGGDVVIDAHGSVHLDLIDWHQSKLALQFSLATSATARQRLAFLLNFLPHPPGTTPYKLTGTISSPVIS
jgi:type II secretion system protein N